MTGNPIVRPYEESNMPHTTKNDSQMNKTRNRPVDTIKHVTKGSKSVTKQSVKTKEIAQYYNNMELESINLL